MNLSEQNFESKEFESDVKLTTVETMKSIHFTLQIKNLIKNYYKGNDEILNCKEHVGDLLDLSSLNEKDIIEAALFLFDRPVTYQELSDILQIDENKIEKYIEELRDEHLDQKTAYQIFDIEENTVQLKLRDEVAIHLHWPFIKRSEVPRHLLRVLSLIAFKEYVLDEKVSPSRLQRIFGKQVSQDVADLQTMQLIKVVQKGNKREITVTEEFLTLFKLPQDPNQVKIAIQRGLREYAMRQLQMSV
jgi:chromosome segregation and condensation protein ScpB